MNIASYFYTPEVTLLTGVMVILLLHLYLPASIQKGVFYASEVLLIGVGVLCLREWALPMQSFFSGHYGMDAFAEAFKGALLILSFFIFIYAERDSAFSEHQSEFYILALFSLSGAMVLTSAMSLIALYLGLELLSLPLYALLALKRDSVHATEAALKYFVMGALASALLLFGFSLLYGFTGSFFLSEIASHLNGAALSNPAFLVALSFIIVALAFKLGVLPFHMWVPDVYQGAPLSVLAFLASIPKLAGFALLIRVLLEGVVHFQIWPGQLMMVLGIFSWLAGNVLALVQTNIKRLLAYSTVANMGLVFILLGLGGGSAEANASFYVLSYALMTVSMLGVLIIVHPGIEHIDQLKGLHREHPFMAFLFLLVLLSFAGIPPLLGFDAKLLALLALLQQGHVALSILVVCLSVVGAAYYLKIVKALYFEAPELKWEEKIGGFTPFWSSLNVLVLLGLGIFPSGLMLLTQRLFS